MIPTNRAFDGKAWVQTEGKTFYRYYKVDRQGIFCLKIRNISINSIYKQGIALGFSKEPNFEGTLSINGQRFVPEKKKSLHYVLSVVEGDKISIELNIKSGYLLLANASDFLDDYPDGMRKVSELTGRTREQFRGCSFTSGFTPTFGCGNAFWIETLSKECCRFYCNDHQMDDDFDDLIFDLEQQILEH